MRSMARRTARGVAGAALALAIGSIGHAAQDPKPAPAAPVTGRWAMALDIQDMGVASVTLVLVQDGEKLTGTYTGRYGQFPLEGVVRARKLEFTVYLKTDAGDSTMYFAGDVGDDHRSLKGTATIEGLGDATWTAKKQPDRVQP